MDVVALLVALGWVQPRRARLCEHQLAGVAGSAWVEFEWTCEAGLADVGLRTARHPKETVVPKEAPGLAPENYERLNHSFYSTEPHDFFGRRLGLLLLAASRGRDLDALGEAGIEVGLLKIGRAPDAPPISEDERLEDDRLREKFVLTEAASLLHHASETLLRLYLAHEELPPCPWLEVARERHFAAFKAKVRKRIVERVADDDYLDALARVFYGSADPLPEITPDAWRDSLENIASWLRHFGRWFLDDAGIYNAAKHGLAIQADQLSFRIMPTDQPDAGIGADGDAVTFLQLDDEGRWRIANRWIDLNELLVATWMATQLLGNLWMIGKWRYTEERPEQVKFFEGPLYGAFREALAKERSGIVPTHLSMTLTYYRTAEDGPDA
jgi:hypothetical protein